MGQNFSPQNSGQLALAAYFGEPSAASLEWEDQQQLCCVCGAAWLHQQPGFNGDVVTLSRT